MLRFYCIYGRTKRNEFHMKKKLFVVDDESLIASLIQSAMDAEFEISHIGSGKSCLDRLTKEQPDVMFFDMHIPEMGGLELVSAVRKNPLLAKIPVVIMSSNKSDFEKNLVLSQGVDGYIGKPLNYADLSEVVRSLPGLEKQQREESLYAKSPVSPYMS